MQCPDCGRVFESPQGRNQHFRAAAHGLACSFPNCTFRFGDSAELSLHVQKAHQQQQQQQQQRTQQPQYMPVDPAIVMAAAAAAMPVAFQRPQQEQQQQQQFLPPNYETFGSDSRNTAAPAVRASRRGGRGGAAQQHYHQQQQQQQAVFGAHEGGFAGARPTLPAPASAARGRGASAGSGSGGFGGGRGGDRGNYRGGSGSGFAAPSAPAPFSYAAAAAAPPKPQSQQQHQHADPAAFTKQVMGTYQQQLLSGTGGPAGVSRQNKNFYDKIIHGFVHSDEVELTFPNTLTPAQRQAVHKLASNFGLHHKSHGEGEARCLKLTKPGASAASAAAENSGDPSSPQTGSKGGNKRVMMEFYAEVQPLCDRNLSSAAKLAAIQELVEPRFKQMQTMLEAMLGRAGHGSPASAALAAMLKGRVPKMVEIIAHSRQAPAASANGGGGGGGNNRRRGGGMGGGGPAANSGGANASAAAAGGGAVPASQARFHLPVMSIASDIAAAVRKHDIVLLTADTGGGKSTQVPQILHDSGVFPPNSLIICTQPRRISAISVAARVADERDEPVGATVGSVVRFENNTSAATRIVYVTTGILLRRLHGDPALQDVACVVVDEVHERDMDTDFVLMLLKEMMAAQRAGRTLPGRRMPLKVVVMSATMQVEKLLDYLTAAPAPTSSSSSAAASSASSALDKAGVPHLNIKGRMFPVQSYFLDDVHRMLGMPPVGENDLKQFAPAVAAAHSRQATSTAASVASPASAAPGSPAFENASPTSSAASPTFGGKAAAFDSFAEQATLLSADKELEAIVPVQLICRLITYIHLTNKPRDNLAGAILVFLPGWAAIDRVMKLMREQDHTVMRELSILPLHSSLSMGEQRLVFDPPPRGFRKVVLATNIAETSITVNDVVYVIDSCLLKSTNHDCASNTTALQCQIVSRANCIQRRGRAGRVRAGECYHLVPRKIFDVLPEFLPAEMLRSNLLDLVLQAKAVAPTKSAEAFLQTAMDPPPRKAVEHAVQHLMQIGALSHKNEALTGMGRALASLPVSVTLGKMLLLAACLGVLDAAAVICAALGSKSPFVRPPPAFGKAAQAARERCAGPTASDHFACLHLYRGWKRAQRPAHFAQENWADHGVLNTMERTVKQLKQSILESGFVQLPGSNNSGNGKKKGGGGGGGTAAADRKKTLNVQELDQYASRYGDNHALLQLLLSMALYPQFAARERENKARGRVSWLCWDEKHTQVSPGSVLANLGHQEFYYREFAVYFERMRLETQVVMFDATAIPRTMLMLGTQKLELLGEAETAALRARGKLHPECRFTALERWPQQQQQQQQQDDEATAASAAAATAAASDAQSAAAAEKPLSCLVVDDGIKRFAAPTAEAEALFELHCALHFFFSYACSQMDLSQFPKELAIAAALVGGNPVSAAADSGNKKAANGADDAEDDDGGAPSAAAAKEQLGQRTLLSFGDGSGKKPQAARRNGNDGDDDEEEEDEDDGAPAAVIVSGPGAALSAFTSSVNTEQLDQLSSLLGDLTVLAAPRQQQQQQKPVVVNSAPAAASPVAAAAAAAAAAPSNNNNNSSNRNDDDDDDEDEIVVGSGAGYF